MTDLRLLEEELDYADAWDEADEWADDNRTRRFRITIEATVSALSDSARYGARLERVANERPDEDDPLLLETAIVDGVMWVNKVTKVELLATEEEDDDYAYDYAPTPVISGR